jgi:DNA-binding MarR family transcriptional regulator
MSATQKAERVTEAGSERRRLSGAAGELADAFKATVRGVIRLRGRDTRLGGAELSYAQLELLSELLARGQAPAGELASAARLSPGAVTEMLDHLAQAGHVERLRSQTDRRVVLSRLTPEGRVLLIAKRDAWEERWRHALEGISERDLRAATQVLIRLQSLFDDAPECDTQSR